VKHSNNENKEASRTTLFDRIKNILVGELSQDAANRVVIDEALQIRPEDRMDIFDLSALEKEMQMHARMKTRRTLYGKKIESALNRLNNGSYGCCTKCDEDIESKRLIARPTTEFCLECKTIEESKERHGGGFIASLHKSLGTMLGPELSFA